MSMREAVEGYYADWSRGDIDSLLKRCTDDVVAVMGPNFTFTGKDEIKSFLEKFGRGMSNVHYKIKNMIEQGNIIMLEGEENYTKHEKDVCVPYMAVERFAPEYIVTERGLLPIEVQVPTG